MKTKLFSLPAVAFGLCLSCSVAQAAAPFVIPPTVISGINVFSGPTFTISGNYGLNDIFSIEANGTVDLASGAFTANAAGVIVGPPTTNFGTHPGETNPGGYFDPNEPYGALLIGNDTLGFYTLFPANASTGLGSSAVPTDIFATETIGQIFGSPLADGTILELLVNDINTYDNSGSFTLTGTISPIPEPTTLALAGLGGLMSLAIFRRRP